MPEAISADFPGGNVGLSQVNILPDCVKVAFTAHPRGGPEALWFYFRLHTPLAGAADLPVELILEHPDNLLMYGGPDGVYPAIRSNDEDWQRLPGGREEVLPDGRRRFCWSLGKLAHPVEIALSPPYGQPEYRKLLHDLGDQVKNDVIGMTPNGRALERVSNNYGEPGSAHPGVYMLARQHAGETPGSWVWDGLCRALATPARKELLLWGVPFADRDGVDEGRYGKDAYPYDLNRAWGEPPMRHETMVIGHDIRRWQARCRPRLILDLHAPTGAQHDGLYVYLPKKGSADVLKQAESWADRLHDALGPQGVSSRFKRIATYPSRWSTPNFTEFAASLGIPALTVEIPYGMIGTRALLPADYQAIGKALADALAKGEG